MKEFIKKIPGTKKLYTILKWLKNYTNFIGDYFEFKKQTKDRRFKVAWRKRKVILGENTSQTSFDRHYIYHPAWAARILAQTKPAEHIDISSTLTFSSIVSAFIPVKFYDYRPANLNLKNLMEEKINLLSLPFEDNSIKSISCMHTVEHIGLGRYGDPINPLGDINALSELQRVLSVDGVLLLVVPIGKPNIEFNAHRIYSYKQIMESLPKLTLKEFSLVPDNQKDGGLIQNAEAEMADKQSYGCGCFWFTKK